MKTITVAPSPIAATAAFFGATPDRAEARGEGFPFSRPD
jgi:hypothetical protein